MNDRHDSRSGLAVADGRGRDSSLSERVRSLRLENQVSQERAKSTFLPWLLCALLAGCVAVLLTRAPFAAPADTSAGAPTGDAAAVRPAAPAASGEAKDQPGDSAAAAPAGSVVLDSKGYIIPAHKIQVSPKVGGMVVKLNIEEGMRVKKGELLAQLETIDYQAERDRAKAMVEMTKARLTELERGNRPEEIAQARAELEEVTAQREQMFLDWKRNRGLTTGNALAAKDYEQAYSSYKAMDRRVEKLKFALKLMEEGPRVERIDAAKAELRQVEADLVKAQWRLDNCTVRAPVDGTILTKKAEEGDIVNPIAFNVSANLCEMADLSDLEISLDIQERDIAKVFKGQACEIKPDAFPRRIYKGTVSRLMPIADQAKGAIPVRVKVTVPREEEGVYLKPNMGVSVWFQKGEK
jgi:HlyD family secretion protein